MWQRARITAACVAREHREVERLLDEAERWLRGQEWEVALPSASWSIPRTRLARDARRGSDRAQAERRGAFPAEVREFIAGYVRGDVPDYQAAAFLMAVWFRGLTPARDLCPDRCDGGERRDG